MDATKQYQKQMILIVEDEPKVAASIKQWMEESGFEVDVAPDGAVGRYLASMNQYELVLLDINLPFVNGFDLCREIRKTNSTVPIILVTALESVEQKIAGFDAGADDYLVKPFDYRELLIRVRALLKRVTSSFKEGPESEEILQIADLQVNIAYKTVIRGREEIILTAKEFALLEYLMRQNGRVASRHEIVEKVWDMNFDSGTNIVEVYINFLRKKIDRNFAVKIIHTKLGMGYYLKA
jgi:two-component system copper resistance phosphate regulon response regulator CusR